MSEVNYGTFESLVLGIKVKDGVILGGTKKVAYGYLTISQYGRTVYVIDGIGFAFAGHVSDIQSVIRQLRAEIKMLELDTSRRPTVKAIAHRLGLLLYSWKLFPYITFAIVGGYDNYPEPTPRLYSLDPVGSVMEEDLIASGFSAEIAIGVLENGYSRDLSLKEGEELVREALKAVSRRDVLAGKLADIVTITQEGVEEKQLKLE